MACLASLFVGCDSAPKVDNSTVKSVDLNRYVGSWYEIAKFDHTFERGLEYAMAKYTLRPDGKIDVLNTGIKDGRAKVEIGLARGKKLYDKRDAIAAKETAREIDRRLKESFRE